MQVGGGVSISRSGTGSGCAELSSGVALVPLQKKAAMHRVMKETLGLRNTPFATLVFFMSLLASPTLLPPPPTPLHS